MHPRTASRVAAVLAVLAFGCSDAARSDGALSAGGERTAPDGGAASTDEAVTDGAVTDGPALPWPRDRLGPPPAPEDNPTTPAKVELGRLLFYDPIVSADRQAACATCHSELWGLSDGLPRSLGVEAGALTGPGRTGPNETRRNAQTLWNVAYRSELFWDGRTPSLEAQVRLPFAEAVELDRNLDAVIEDLAAIPRYVELFSAAFPGASKPVSVTSFTRAIAAFERTLVSDRALYDAYAAGDEGAMSDSMIRGMQLFEETGCATCHVPPLFESTSYADRDVTPVEGISDEGRYEVTGDPTDRGYFRVPTLRNVRESAPYFHNGTVATLDAAIRHEVAVSVERNESRELSDAEIEALLTFVQKALVDRSREPDRPEEVPSGLPVPIDGFRIPR